VCVRTDIKSTVGMRGPRVHKRRQRARVSKREGIGKNGQGVRVDGGKAIRGCSIPAAHRQLWEWAAVRASGKVLTRRCSPLAARQ
jgi:hypothetical protein